MRPASLLRLASAGRAPAAWHPGRRPWLHVPVRAARTPPLAVAKRDVLAHVSSRWRSAGVATKIVLVGLGCAAIAGGATVAKAVHDAHAERDLRTPWTTQLHGIAAGFARSAITFGVVAVIVADYKWLWLRHGHLGIDSGEYKRLRSLVHQRSADRFLWLCQHHGGIYTKSGQYLSSLVRMVPREYTETLAVLQDKAPFHSFDEVVEVFRQEFGALPSDYFMEFDVRPVAAASLAQVHHAVTNDGREVAVKVQYLDVVQNFYVDVRCMAWLTEMVGFFFPEFELGWVVTEFERTLINEFDFRLEGRNTEATSRRFDHWPSVHVPTIYWDHTTSRILTMEWINGHKITNVAALIKDGHDLPAIRRTLIECFSDMIFCYGTIHGDPHPGNMLVRRNPADPTQSQLVLLDHGLYRTISPEFRRTYCDLWVGILTMDDALLRSVGERIGAEAFWDKLPLMFAGHFRGHQRILGDDFTDSDRTAFRENFKEFKLEDAVEFLDRVPRDMLLVMRSMNLCAGVYRALGGENLPKFRIHAWYATRGRCLDGQPSSPAALLRWARTWTRVWWRLWIAVPLALLVRSTTQLGSKLLRPWRDRQKPTLHPT